MLARRFLRKRTLLTDRFPEADNVEKLSLADIFARGIHFTGSASQRYPHHLRLRNAIHRFRRSNAKLRTCLSVAAAGGRVAALVFAYHSDGGTASGFRTFIALEAEASDGAVFVYPDVPGNVFDTESYDGRTAEQDFVQDVVGAMQGEFGIARGRVFIAGFSRGAYMANILGCRLGPDVVRAVTAAEGSIYQAFDASNNPDYTFTGTGGISCPMPPSMVIWGTAATASPYSDGVAYRNLLQATQQCSANSLPGPVAPCVEYGSCKRNVVWCSIPGLADALWSGQAHATWTFFDDFLFSNDFN